MAVTAFGRDQNPAYGDQALFIPARGHPQRERVRARAGSVQRVRAVNHSAVGVRGFALPSSPHHARFAQRTAAHRRTGSRTKNGVLLCGATDREQMRATLQGPSRASGASESAVEKPVQHRETSRSGRQDSPRTDDSSRGRGRQGRADGALVLAAPPPDKQTAAQQRVLARYAQRATGHRVRGPRPPQWPPLKAAPLEKSRSALALAAQASVVHAANAIPPWHRTFDRAESWQR